MTHRRGKHTRAGKGFSLIELMIVVAIIGILASIAVPNFLFLKCKAKRTEAYSLIGALKVFQFTYFQESGNYLCDKNLLRPVGFDFSSQQYTTIDLQCIGIDDFFVDIKSVAKGPSGNFDRVYSYSDGLILQSDGCY